MTERLSKTPMKANHSGESMLKFLEKASNQLEEIAEKRRMEIERPSTDLCELVINRQNRVIDLLDIYRSVNRVNKLLRQNSTTKMERKNPQLDTPHVHRHDMEKMNITTSKDEEIDTSIVEEPESFKDAKMKIQEKDTTKKYTDTNNKVYKDDSEMMVCRSEEKLVYGTEKLKVSNSEATDFSMKERPKDVQRNMNTDGENKVLTDEEIIVCNDKEVQVHRDEEMEIYNNQEIKSLKDEELNVFNGEVKDCRNVFKNEGNENFKDKDVKVNNNKDMKTLNITVFNNEEIEACKVEETSPTKEAIVVRKVTRTTGTSTDDTDGDEANQLLMTDTLQTNPPAMKIGRRIRTRCMEMRNTISRTFEACLERQAELRQREN